MVHPRCTAVLDCHALTSILIQLTDDYLRRFERYAINQGWDASLYAVFLSGLLTGHALEVYSRLPASVANDYDKLKHSLLEWHQLTEEDF